MSIFSPETDNVVEMGSSGGESMPDGEVRDTKTVTVLESDNGNNSKRHRATIPAEFSRSLGLDGGDTLLMKLTDDGILVKVPHE